jgi:hypothetical protein
MFMKLLFYSLIFTLALTSCDFINPDEQEPAYLKVEDYDFKTYAGQGMASEKFTELWTYANDNILSIHQTGVHTPVLSEGSTKISIRPGIKNYGISDQRIYYPFIEPFDTVIDFKSFEEHTIHARFKYYPGVLVDATRSFESGNNITVVAGQGYFDVVNDPSIAFEGNRCGKAYTTSAGTVFCKDENSIQIVAGKTTFLEMNYSCTQPFTVGVASTVGGSLYSNDLVTMAATASVSVPTWNQIYIDLSPIALLYPNATSHNIYLLSTSANGQPIIIYLDNLKIVNWQ